MPPADAVHATVGVEAPERGETAGVRGGEVAHVVESRGHRREVERRMVLRITGDDEQRVDAELVHARDHRLGLGKAVVGIASHLHRHTLPCDRGVPLVGIAGAKALQR